MAGVLAVTILLGVGFINHFVNPIIAQEGCISHPLPPEIVDKLVSAANIAISQSSAISCSSKEDRAETVDGYALATVALLQHSLSAAKEDLSLTKVELENVSITVTDLTAKTKNLENAVTSVSSLQSSLSSTQNEVTTCKRTCDNALATVALLQHSLIATEEDLSLTKVELENVSLTVTDLTAKTKNLENAVTSVSSLQSSCDNGLTEIQSTLTVLRNEIAELREAYESVTSKSVKCKDGWFLFRNSCYFFSTAKATWQNGRQQCLDLGADYVKISSDAELTFILNIVGYDTWIGLNDLQTEGYMQWISDGTEHQINRSWWIDGQPDNYRNNEDCVHIWILNEKTLLNDSLCTHTFSFLCEMKAEATN